MRISQIRITNFRAVREFELTEIPDVVVLAGPNGTGKSTVLEAIAVWKEAVAPYYSTRLPGPDPVSAGAERAEIGITVEPSLQEIDFWRQGLEAQGQPVPPAEEMARFASTVHISRDGRVQAGGISGFKGFRDLLCQLDRSLPIGVMEYIGPYRRLPTADIGAIPLTPITPDREKQTRLYDVDSKFNEVKQYLIALEVQDWQRYYHDQGERQDSSKGIKELFEVFFSPKKLVGARSKDTPQGLRLKLLVETPAGQHDIDNLSSGEKEILMVFATLHRLRLRNSVLLYDEPDLHLNAALERKLIPELLRLGEGNQIWVSTHSVEMIDLTPLDSLLVMSHYSGGNQVTRAVSESDKIGLFQFLGASTGLQLISERVVFIEGEDSSTDKQVLEEIFADHRHQVSFVPAGAVATLEWVGKRGLQVLQEASRHADFFLVRDRDFLDDDQVEALRQALGGRLWVWRRYHIENYLLDSVAVHRSLMRVGITKYVTPDDVETTLKGLADSLRDEALARYVGCMLNRQVAWQNFKITGGNDPIAQLQARVQQARARAEEKLAENTVTALVDEVRPRFNDWDAGAWRELVPGKRLLRLFVGELADGLSYDRLRSLIINEMRDDRSLWPAEFDGLIRAVLEGLE